MQNSVCKTTNNKYIDSHIEAIVKWITIKEFNKNINITEKWNLLKQISMHMKILCKPKNRIIQC